MSDSGRHRAPGRTDAQEPLITRASAQGWTQAAHNPPEIMAPGTSNGNARRETTVPRTSTERRELLTPPDRPADDVRWAVPGLLR